MMILITGGAYQGKSDCAKRMKQDPEYENYEILEDIHLLVKGFLQEDKDPYEEMERLLSQYSGVILTVNELGCGVVPMDPFDRRWREITGRICCKLAKEATRVYRVTCGIPTRIK